jgi:hypothetical protein
MDLRMIVGFNLDQGLDNFSRKLPRAGRVVWGPIVSDLTSENGSIVAVGRDGEVWRLPVSILDHAEETFVHGHTINGPGRVKYLHKREISNYYLRIFQYRTGVLSHFSSVRCPKKMLSSIFSAQSRLKRGIEGP